MIYHEQFYQEYEISPGAKPENRFCFWPFGVRVCFARLDLLMVGIDQWLAFWQAVAEFKMVEDVETKKIVSEKLENAKRIRTELGKIGFGFFPTATAVVLKMPERFDEISME